MRTILTLSICALFALGTAEAKTFYVDASRPNNKGNGRSLKTAKKTIQAAVNIAKNGDTIIVYPGTYAPISTKNKKIKIRAMSGNARTSIEYKGGSGNAVAKLGKAWKTYVEGFYVESGGYTYWVEPHSYSSDPQTKGTKTALSGFTLDGAGYWPGVGVSGGTLRSCVLQGCGSPYYGLAYGATLEGCDIMENDSLNFVKSTLNRCKVQYNYGSSYYASESSKFANCLLAGNQDTMPFTSCTFANCTIADNAKFTMKKTKAYNTIFNGVAAGQFKKAKKNTLKNCFKGANPKFAGSDDYHLAKGSPCVNKGTKAATAKKLYGKKDLDGNKRVKGKSVDIGCYEF